MIDTFVSPFVVLSAILLLPALGAVLVAVLPRQSEEESRIFSLWITVVVLILVLWLAFPTAARPGAGLAGWDQGRVQYGFSVPWVETFSIYYFLGLDGINFPLVLLTALLGIVAMLASWNITTHVRSYCALFLLLHTGMLGVFLALDLFLFYVFWEVVLLPMYFLIGVWGGPRKEYAAIKFFLFTLAGSVAMLVAILMLYAYSDLRQLNEVTLQSCFIDPDTVAAGRGQRIHTFNMLALAELGRLPRSPFNEQLWGIPIHTWVFWLLMFGFLIKLPAVPFHTWLPDAHVEAPTPISMLLAGVLLKMGGYGILRLCYTICPADAHRFAWIVVTIGLVSMVYGAFAALAQSDFKRLVAYSSVSHMGYVLLGLGAWSAVPGDPGSRHFWTMGMCGAMYQMVAHGITSAGMFFLVGAVYDRVHHRDLNQFGGLFNRMPFYGAMMLIIFFAAMGLPGLCGFVGEFFVILASWRFHPLAAVIAASVIVITAGYILWTVARVLFGASYKGPHPEALCDLTTRERWVIIPLAVLAVLLGIYPKVLLQFCQTSINRTVYQLATWQERNVVAAVGKELSSQPFDGWPRKQITAPEDAGPQAGQKFTPFPTPLPEASPPESLGGATPMPVSPLPPVGSASPEAENVSSAEDPHLPWPEPRASLQTGPEEVNAPANTQTTFPGPRDGKDLQIHR